MLLENPKTGTLGIVYESAISEKMVPTFFFAKKKCSKMKLHELYIDGKKKWQSFARHGSENGNKSHILFTSDFKLTVPRRNRPARENREFLLHGCQK